MKYHRGTQFNFKKASNDNDILVAFDKYRYTHFNYMKNLFDAFCVFTLGFGPLLLTLFYPGVGVYVKTKDALDFIPISLSYKERWLLRYWYEDWVKVRNEKLSSRNKFLKTLRS